MAQRKAGKLSSMALTQRFTAVGNNRQKFLQNIWNRNNEASSSIDANEDIDQSPGIVFEPLQFGSQTKK